jgi:hypothetical protein
MESPKTIMSHKVMFESPPSRRWASFRKKNSLRPIVYTYNNTKPNYNTTTSLKQSSPIIRQTFSRNPRHTTSNITIRNPLRRSKLRGKLGIQPRQGQQSSQFQFSKGSPKMLRKLPLNNTRKALSFNVINTNNNNSNSHNSNNSSNSHNSNNSSNSHNSNNNNSSNSITNSNMNYSNSNNSNNSNNSHNANNANSMKTLRNRRGAIIPDQIPVSSMNRLYNTYKLPISSLMASRRREIYS